MNGLLQKLLTLPQLRELTEAVTGRERCAAVTGLSPVHRAMLSAAVASETKRPLLLLCADEKECARQAADLRVLLGTEPVCLPERELRLRPAAYSRQWENSRLSALYRMARGDAPVVVATAAAMSLRCLPREVLLGAAFTLEVGGRYDVRALCEHLTAAGYTRTDQVEGAGQFALRGGILDVFSPNEERPLRCEFFDDELDSMGEFEVSTQRRVLNRREVHLLPADEVLPFAQEGTAEDAAARMEEAARHIKKEHAAARQRLTEDAELLRQGVTPPGSDRCMAAVYPEKTTAFDYLAPDTVICVSEAGRVQESLRGFLFQTRQDVTAAVECGMMAGAFGDLTLNEPELEAVLSRFALCQLESLPTSRYLLPPRLLLDVGAKQLAGYGGSLDTAATDITHYLTTGFGVLVLCGGEVRCRNMQELLRQRHIPAALALEGNAAPANGQVLISVGALSAGSEWPTLKLAVLTEGQLTRALSGKAKKPRQPKSDSRQRLLSYADLEVGDLVVHIHHGIGRFAGMLRLPVDGVEKDYIKIQYAGSDCLYVPATSLDLVSKYIGGGEETEKVRLNKLSGDQWTKTTRRAKAAARDLAEGLIRLYAERQRLGGFAFSPDSPWQQEFEDAFDYTETEDQLTAIREIKADMEKPVPMDRLLCGDVGYGKTEVALRAAMKCILDGKQAAILVPTTVLAQQHYATAAARFRSFPVTVEVLSRFRTPKQVREILSRVRDGRIDLLIGTHKLLGKGVEFKDLGLLIIDEEQRFGVTHKEKLRERARQVDTLTLSATPIPRTLNMAMSGIRDMSTIEQPPQDRQPVQTYVLEHDWGILTDAIRRELGRGGQVYYLHNRVDSIDSTAKRLRDMLGDGAAVETAHGKMAEGELSGVMSRMAEGDIDVLVCTTIIETGIDIPNVNTLIIEDADNMGLSQLHQIRGRIGRSARRAYAYLTYRTGKVLTEVAAKRLTAIREYVEFGSGFRIAMRDLEIRGAGNLLGPEQSGYMMSVGYDMYLKLLNDAVLEQQGRSVPVRVECSADLTVAAYIPEDYVPAAEQRMDLYRRIAALRTAEDRDELTDELLDRYGDLPPAVEALLSVALLRAAAMERGITDITQKGRQLLFSFDRRVDAAALLAVCTMAAYRSRTQLTAGASPRLTLYLQPQEDPLTAAGGLVDALRLHEKDTQLTEGRSPLREELIMKNNWIRFLAGALASVILVGAFALTGGMKGGKSTDGLLYQASGLHPDGEMLVVSGQTVTCEEYLRWVDYVCQYISSRIPGVDWNAQVGEDGMTYGEYVKIEAIETVKQYAVIRAWAQQEGVTLTEADREALAAQREEYVSYYGGEEAYQQQLALVGVSEETNNAMLETQYLYRDLYQAFCTPGTALYPDDKTLSDYADRQGYVSVYALQITGDNADTMAADLLDRWQAAEDKAAEYAAMCEELQQEADGIVTLAYAEGDALSEAISALAVGDAAAVIDPYGEGTCFVVLRADTDLAAVAETYFDVLFESKLDSAAVVTNSKLYDALDVGTFYERLTQLRTEMEAAMEPDDAQSDAADTQDDAASADTQDDDAADDSAA